MKSKTDLDPQILRDLFVYDEIAGCFYLRNNMGRWKAGHKVGYKKKNGYVGMCVLDREVYVHRAAWAFVHGHWPAHDTDHINGVRDDNRIENLRAVSRAMNMQNIHFMKKKSACGFFGVSYSKSERVFIVNSACAGERVAKRFKDPSEAHAFYKQKKLETIERLGKTYDSKRTDS